MQVGFMVTNGGPHPADAWADQTTETILALLVDDPTNTSAAAAAARQAKRDLRPKLFAILNEHHGSVQEGERKTLPRHLVAAREHVAMKIELPNVFDAENKVLAVLATTPWKVHFAKPDVQQVICNIVRQHTADVMHIERRWHQDRLEAAAKKGA